MLKVDNLKRFTVPFFLCLVFLVGEVRGQTSSISAVSNVSCYGGSDGSITAAISGGTAPYTYSWSHGITISNSNDSTNSVSGLSSGTYTVSITDVNGSVGVDTVQIQEPEEMIVSFSIDTKPICSDEATGIITVSANSGLESSLEESFDQSTIPADWTSFNDIVSTAPNAFWKFSGGPDYAMSGTLDHTGNSGSYAWVDGSSPYPAIVSLESPAITLTSGTGTNLSFWMKRHTQGYGITVWNDFTIDLYDGSSWNLAVFSHNSDTQNGDWEEFTVDLSSYTIVGAIKVRFNVSKVAQPFSFYDDIVIDDITLGVANEPSYVWSHGDTSATATALKAGTYTVVASNDIGCSASGTVTLGVSDTIPPVVVSKPLSLRLNASGEAFIGPEELDGGSSDGCGIADFMISQSDFTCEDVNPDGIEVILTVVDINGNMATDTTIVTVIDDVNPEVISKDFTVELDVFGAAILEVEDLDGGTTDGCGIADLTISRETFSCDDIEDAGVQVILTARDYNGNINSDTATVQVVDRIPPAMLVQKAVIELDENGEARLSPQDIDAGSTDACGIRYRELSQQIFTCEDLGKDNEVVLSITDYSGNISAEISTVQVKDNISPTVVTQADTIYLDADGRAVASVSRIDAGSYDNCKITSLELSKTNFDCDDIGRNQVQLIAEDLAGNTTTGRASIVVMDREAPTVLTQDIRLELVDGSAILTAEQIDAGSFDACGIAHMEVSPNQFDCSDIGTSRIVSLSVTDIHDNIRTKTAIVAIESIELGVSVSETELQATIPNANYQWLNCEAGFAPITEATGQTFSATETGNYAVEVSQFGCVDTSACFAALLSTSIDDNSFQKAISLFPNPTNGAFTIELNDVYEVLWVEITNMAGQIVSRQAYNHVQVIQDEIKGAEGFYFVKISTEKDQQAIFKIFHQ